MKRLCAAVELSRASYYRHRCAPQRLPETMVLRDAIQKIALQFPAWAWLLPHCTCDTVALPGRYRSHGCRAASACRPARCPAPAARLWHESCAATPKLPAWFRPP